MKKYRYLIRELDETNMKNFNGNHFYFTSDIYVDFTQNYSWNAYGYDSLMDEIINDIPYLSNRCFSVQTLIYCSIEDLIKFPF